MIKKYKQLRKDFPIFSQKLNDYNLVYCDNAATTQKPIAVIDAITNFYTTINANVHRGIYSSGEQASILYEKARQTIAEFIGAQTEEIIFTSGATESINFIASTWGEQYISQGDEVVISELEHHANLVPWIRLTQKKNATLKYIPVTDDGQLDLSTLDTLITDKTKLVAVTHVSNALGSHVDINRIIAAAQKVNAYTLIDAAQSVAHQKINVANLNCDFLVFSGHKIVGPTGIGVLYINKKLHPLIEPYQVGGSMVEDVTFSKALWTNAPHKFEAGTPPIAQAIGLSQAVHYIKKNINFDELRLYEARLCKQLIQGLSQLTRIKLLGPIEELKEKGHIVSFIVDGIHSHDVAAFLDSKGISVRAGHHCAQPLAKKLGYDASVRISFYFYNTPEEVDYILTIIKSIFTL